MTVRTREEWLRALITGAIPPLAAVDGLAAAGWDAEDTCVVLMLADVQALLRRYLDRDASATDIEEWANAIESREDIAYEDGYADRIGDLIFDLANPEINGELTFETVEESLRLLGT